MDHSDMRWLAISVVVLTTFCDVLSQRPSFCDLPEDYGPGKETVVLLYYKKATGNCHPFHYGGHGGNENRFYSDRMCMGNCSLNVSSVYPADEREACHFKKDFGHCMSRILRWYYDPVRGKCNTFHYTGCGGNGNRFPSRNHCNSTCAGIIDEGDMDEDDTDTPVGLIIGILLGVIGAIVIIVTIVMAVKNKPKKVKMVQKEDDSPLQVHPEGIEMEGKIQQ